MKGEDQRTEHEGAEGVEIAMGQLSEEALRGLVEEFVTREGTEYGSGGSHLPSSGAQSGSLDPEWSLEDKVAQVYRQLEEGTAKVVFDLEAQSASIVSETESRRQRSR